MRGICYPVPWGDDPGTPNRTATTSQQNGSDLRDIAFVAMGANTIRLYTFKLSRRHKGLPRRRRGGEPRRRRRLRDGNAADPALHGGAAERGGAAAEECDRGASSGAGDVARGNELNGTTGRVLDQQRGLTPAGSRTALSSASSAGGWQLFVCDDYVAHAHFNATTVVTYGGCMFRDNAPAFIAALDDLRGRSRGERRALLDAARGRTCPRRALEGARAYGSMDGWCLDARCVRDSTRGQRTAHAASPHPAPPRYRCATSTCGRITPTPARTSPRSTGMPTPMEKPLLISESTTLTIRMRIRS